MINHGAALQLQCSAHPLNLKGFDHACVTRASTSKTVCTPFDSINHHQTVQLR